MCNTCNEWEADWEVLLPSQRSDGALVCRDCLAAALEDAQDRYWRALGVRNVRVNLTVRSARL